VPVSFDGDAGVVESGDYEFFVGIRSDPFFFDLEGFQHDFEFTGEDFFIDKNVFSIVLEMPNKALGEGQIGFWCRVLGPENGDLSQIDRMGRPLTNMLYTEGEDKNAFNQVGPDQDRDLFLETFVERLQFRGGPDGRGDPLAGRPGLRPPRRRGFPQRPQARRRRHRRRAGSVHQRANHLRRGLSPPRHAVLLPLPGRATPHARRVNGRRRLTYDSTTILLSVWESRR
jgi:hypothetical protein